MNIHKKISFIQAVKEEEILHLSNWYIRKEFSDNTFVWKPMYEEGYAIQIPDALEKEYQKLINNPTKDEYFQLDKVYYKSVIIHKPHCPKCHHIVISGKDLSYDEKTLYTYKCTNCGYLQ